MLFQAVSDYAFYSGIQGRGEEITRAESVAFLLTPIEILNIAENPWIQAFCHLEENRFESGGNE